MTKQRHGDAQRNVKQERLRPMLLRTVTMATNMGMIPPGSDAANAAGFYDYDPQDKHPAKKSKTNNTGNWQRYGQVNTDGTLDIHYKKTEER